MVMRYILLISLTNERQKINKKRHIAGFRPMAVGRLEYVMSAGDGGVYYIFRACVLAYSRIGQLYLGLFINRLGGNAAKNARTGWVNKIMTQ